MFRHNVILCSCAKHGACQHVAHLVQEIDKYGHRDGRIAHSRKQAITTAKQSPRQRKPHLCNASGKDENKNSIQEQSGGHGVPNCDPSGLEHHRNDSPSPGKGVEGCLHARNYRTANNSNSKRHSYHSAPTPNGEADAEILNVADTKNDFASRRTPIKAELRSQTRPGQPELRAHAQLMDVLQRVQKLEDYQHARNLEAAKVGPIQRTRLKKKV